VTGTGQPSATKLRHQLSTQLRELRTATPRTQAEAAAALGWSESKVMRIEGGIVGISASDLRALLDLYGVTDDSTVQELTFWATQARRQPWSRFRDVHSSAFLRYLGQESHATRISEFEPQFVPGLFQTEDYARALLAASDVNEFPEEVADRIVEARLRRQEILDTAECPTIEVFLDQNVIQRPIGGSRVMAAQLDRLLGYADHSKVIIRIMPLEIGAYAGMRASFVVLGFDDQEDSVLYVEGQSREKTTVGSNSANPMAAHLRSFQMMQKVAASVDESSSIIRESRDHLNRMSRGAH